MDSTDIIPQNVTLKTKLEKNNSTNNWPILPNISLLLTIIIVERSDNFVLKYPYHYSILEKKKKKKKENVHITLVTFPKILLDSTIPLSFGRAIYAIWQKDTGRTDALIRIKYTIIKHSCS